MRAGTVAQHVNVGPTSRNSADVLSGRLKHHPIYMWIDFTDEEGSNLEVFGAEGLNTSIVDKNNLGNIVSVNSGQSAGATRKGVPEWVSGSTEDGTPITGAGANNHMYVRNWEEAFNTRSPSPGGTYMDQGRMSYTVTPIDGESLENRNFTLVWVGDFDASGSRGDPAIGLSNLHGHYKGPTYCIELPGSDHNHHTDTMKYSWLGTVEEDDDTGNFTMAKIVWYSKGRNQNPGVWLSSSVDDNNPGTALPASVDAVQNWDGLKAITVVGNNDGSAKMYINKTEVASLDAGEFADEYFRTNSSTTGGNGSIFSNPANHTQGYFIGKAYEVLVFKKALSYRELENDVWHYLGEKYDDPYLKMYPSHGH